MRPEAEINSASTPYLRPSAQANRVVGAVLLGGQPFSPTSPCAGNCSYLTAVSAPAFSCSPGLKNASALTWNATILGAGLTYIAGNFDAAPPVNQYTDWDFLGHYADAGRFLPVSNGTNFTCISYNATYNLNYTFMGSVSSVSIESVALNQPAGQMSEDQGFVNQVHSWSFNATTNYYAILTSLYTLIAGNITSSESGNSVDFISAPTSLAVTQTQLVTYVQDGNITWADVAASMESLLTNITLSILTLDPTQNSSTICVYANTRPYFSYNSRRLWIIYALGLGCALLSDLAGLLALMRNSFGARAGLTDFLAATRNAELHDVDFSQGTQRVRLRYGALRGEAGRHAFAFPESLYAAADGEKRHIRTLKLRAGSANADETHQNGPAHV